MLKRYCNYEIKFKSGDFFMKLKFNVHYRIVVKFRIGVRPWRIDLYYVCGRGSRMIIFHFDHDVSDI